MRVRGPRPRPTFWAGIRAHFFENFGGCWSKIRQPRIGQSTPAPGPSRRPAPLALQSMTCACTSGLCTCTQGLTLQASVLSFVKPYFRKLSFFGLSFKCVTRCRMYGSQIMYSLWGPFSGEGITSRHLLSVGPPERNALDTSIDGQKTLLMYLQESQMAVTDLIPSDIRVTLLWHA